MSDADERDRARILQLRAQALLALEGQGNPAPGAPAGDPAAQAAAGWQGGPVPAAGSDILTGAPLRPNRLAAAAGSMAHGATLGASDEIAGGVASLASLLNPDVSMGDAYARARDEARQGLEMAREDFPITSGVSEAAGAIGTGLAYSLPAMAGRGMLGASAVGAGVGATEGLAYGFLSGEDGGWSRAKNAVPYTFMGAAGGAAMPVITRGLRDSVGGIADRFFNRGSQSRANRAVTRTVDRAGMTPDDVSTALQRAMQDGQPEFRVADALGVPGQRRLSGIARSGDVPGAEIADFLNQRQTDQPERLSSFISDAFDARRSAQELTDALTSARSDAADLAYGAARQNARPVDVTPVIDEINDLLRSNVSLDGGKTGLTDTAIGRRLAGFGRQLSTGDFQLINFNDVLETKQEMGRAIEAMRRSGSVPPSFARVYARLDEVLEASSDGYRAANDGFREASRVIDAVGEGKAMVAPGQRAVDTTARFSDMTPDQQAAARTGYGDRLLARIEAQPGEANRARPLTSTKMRTEADTMAIDPELLRRRVDRENVMFETRARALGGSRTADNMADIADVQTYDMGMIANLLSGRWGAAGTQAAGALQDVFTGMNPQTKQLIADALLSGDADVLRAAARQTNMSDAQRAIVEQIVRTLSVQQGGGVASGYLSGGR